jgi:hypothetical protein
MHYAMKAYGGVRFSSTTIGLGAKVEVSGYYHASADFHPKKEPSVTIVQEAGWAQEPVWTIWRSEKITCF